MTSNPKTRAKRPPSDSGRSWLIPIVVIIVLGVAIVTTIVIASSGGDDDDGPDSVALDDLSPEELADSGEFGTVEISGTPLPPFEGESNIGLVAPSFTTDSLDGERVTVEASDQAKVIGFFVHSCSHCQREIPHLTTWLGENELPEGVELITVSTLANPTTANWPPSAWFLREGYPEQVLIDDTQGTAAVSYGITSYPYWVVVDEDMRVLHQSSGELSDEGFEELLAVASGNSAS